MSDPEPLDIAVIVGSLRASSFSRKLALEAARLAPEGVTLRLQAIGDLPHYDGDLEVDGGPERVRALKAAITAADGLLFVTPEYNHSVPGVLKNAIDWASRPAFESCLARKPAALISCSPSPVGGARALSHLEVILVGTLTELVPAPSMAVGSVFAKFDDAGRLIDEATEARLTRLLADFAAWIRARAT